MKRTALAFPLALIAASSIAAAQNSPPVCVLAPTSTIACQGATTSIKLDASHSFDPDGDPLTFDWVACPGSTFDDPHSATPVLTLDTSASCSFTCGVRLVISDGSDFGFCRTFVEVVPAPPGELECRVTGGTVGSYQGDTFTSGGQAGAPTASQPQPYGEWTHHQRSGPTGRFIFHAGTASAPAETEIDVVTCADPGSCEPALTAPAKQIDFEGVGVFKNGSRDFLKLHGIVPGKTLHRFEVHIEDLGEPGNQGDPTGCPTGGSKGGLADCACPDFYWIRIHATEDPNSSVIYEVLAYLDGGNLQIHDPL